MQSCSDRSRSVKLLTALRVEAIRRGLLDPKTSPVVADVFRLVRDMPYRRPTHRVLDAQLREWCGTCSSKHVLLKQLLREMGLRVRLAACTSRLDLREDPRFRALDTALADLPAFVVDVHNFLFVDLPRGSMTVDATWPWHLHEKLGVVSNEQFVLGQNQTIAATPIETWIVPDTRDPYEFKQHLLESQLTAEERRGREIFFQRLLSYVEGA